MDFLNNLLISVTIVAIFSAIVLTIINEDNSQREIVKIACGMLMIVVLLNGINNGFSSNFTSFEDFYSDYEGISNDAISSFSSLEQELIKSQLEQLVLDETSVDCNIFFLDDYQIQSVTVFDDTKNQEICELLGISFEQIEYIESR